MSNSAPLVTFAIPFYSNNAETGFRYLKITIDSVLSQTIPNWKLILVDDKSPIAGVKEFIAAYGDNRLSYYRNDVNKGQAGNWNVCISLIDTPYYNILHADDALEPRYAEVMLKTMADNPDTAVIFCNSKIIDGNDNEIFSFVDLVKKFLYKGGALQGEEGLAELMKGDFIMCPTVFFRRSKTQHFKFHESDWSIIPDFYYWVQLLINDCRLLGIKDFLFRYRRHQESGTAIGRKANLMFEQESRFYDFVAEEATKKGWGKVVSRARNKRMVKLRTIYYMLHDLGGLRLTAAKQKLNLIGQM
jgi:glycosyltransferase involved in cell wall biosynthesis